MISLVLTIEAPARTNKTTPEIIPRTNTGILEVALTEVILRTEILTNQDMINIMVLKTDPAILAIMTNTALSLEVTIIMIDQILRIKVTTNPNLLPTIKMVVILELPVDPLDPELLEEATDKELQVNQISTEIRADL